MFIVDTHAHLDFPEYKDDLDAVLKRAQEQNVGCIITVGTDLASSRQAVALAKRYPHIYATVGIHPNDAKNVTPDQWPELAKLISSDKVVAVGEIGLDFHKNESPHDVQKDVFARQLKLAKEYKKPVIIHCRAASDGGEPRPAGRDASSDCLAILKQIMGNQIKGVAHCFSGSADVAKEYLALGMYISVAGPITYPNASALRETVKTAVPIESLMLETDCPFLAPQAMRGKRNEPSYLTHHIKELAKLYKLSEADICRITTLNAHHLFGIDVSHQCDEVGTSSTETQCVSANKSKGKPNKSAITYAIRNSLYLNITNRCTCKCYFCVTHFTDYVKGHNLRLETEPSSDEIIAAITADVHTKYKEVVFCGYGEPTLRLDVIKDVCRHLKQKDMSIRINTNGHANLIANRLVAKELKGLVDNVSVSLNALDPKEYQKVCQSQFGEEAFDKVIEFIKDAKEHLPYVEVTTVVRPGIDVKPYQDFACKLGVDFRARIYNEVG